MEDFPVREVFLFIRTVISARAYNIIFAERECFQFQLVLN